MKNRFLFLTLTLGLSLLLAASDLFAQKFPDLDKSPADISYYRPDRGAPPAAKVIYSRPQANGRVIFGERGIVPYGAIWRTGANEATEVTFYQDVTFGGERVAAGTYSLFTIPGEDTWTIILNNELNQWGAYRYNEEEDALRVEVEAGSIDEGVEAFSIVFHQGDMILAWDQTRVRVPIDY